MRRLFILIEVLTTSFSTGVLESLSTLSRRIALVTPPDGGSVNFVTTDLPVTWGKHQTEIAERVHTVFHAPRVTGYAAMESPNTMCSRLIDSYLLATIGKNSKDSNMKWETPHEAVEHLLSMEDVLEYLNAYKGEQDFLVATHHDLGRWVRNNYGLWEGCAAAPVKDAPLYYWYYERGLVHPDDMSACLLKQLHAVFHKNDFNLDNEVKFYKRYWKRCWWQEMKSITRVIEEVIAKYK